MRAKKVLKEAILRTHQTTEKANQTQEQLLHMEQQAKEILDQPQLNESPKNLIRSWYNLRNLDQNLAENKYSDLSDDEKIKKHE
jgi:CRISPR/Cas system-associated endonuclease/helicase Cas3